MALWSASALGVVRCEFNGKVEYRNPPCPQGTERSLGVAASVASPAATAPTTLRRPAPTATAGPDALREDENARFMQQERRIREERLLAEAERAARDAANRPVAAPAETTPSVLVSPSTPAPVQAPAAVGDKASPATAGRTPVPTPAGASASRFGGAWLYVLPLVLVIVLAVVLTRRGNGSAFRWTLAAICGMLGGLLVYFIVAMVAMPRGGPGPLFVLLTMSTGWVVCAYGLGNRAGSWLEVLQRAFLLGAVQWLIVIPASWIWTGRAVVSTVDQIGPTATAVAGAILGGGLIAMLTGGVALFMLVLCTTGYLIVYFVLRSQTPALAASA